MAPLVIAARDAAFLTAGVGPLCVLHAGEKRRVAFVAIGLLGRVAGRVLTPAFASREFPSIYFPDFRQFRMLAILLRDARNQSRWGTIHRMDAKAMHLMSPSERHKLLLRK